MHKTSVALLAAGLLMSFGIVTGGNALAAPLNIIGTWEGTATVANPDGFSSVDFTMIVTDQSSRLFRGTFTIHSLPEENLALTGCVVGDQVSMTLSELTIDQLTRDYIDATYYPATGAMKGVVRSAHSVTAYCNFKKQ